MDRYMVGAPVQGARSSQSGIDSLLVTKPKLVYTEPSALPLTLPLELLINKQANPHGLKPGKGTCARHLCWSVIACMVPLLVYA